MFGLITFLCITTKSLAWDSGLRQKYDSYGEDWIFMPDGFGHPQVAVLKGEEPEDPRVVLEQPIGFLLYTRYDLFFLWKFKIIINWEKSHPNNQPTVNTISFILMFI